MAYYLVKFLAFYIGCMSCISLQRDLGLSPVLSSAIVGFIGTFFKLQRFDPKELHAAIYAGSFAGMCSADILSGPETIIYVSLLGSFLYVWSRPLFTGYGGRLGTIAFISSVFLFLSKGLW